MYKLCYYLSTRLKYSTLAASIGLIMGSKVINISVHDRAASGHVHLLVAEQIDIIDKGLLLLGDVGRVVVE